MVEELKLELNHGQEVVPVVVTHSSRGEQVDGAEGADLVAVLRLLDAVDGRVPPTVLTLIDNAKVEHRPLRCPHIVYVDVLGRARIWNGIVDTVPVRQAIGGALATQAAQVAAHHPRLVEAELHKAVRLDARVGRHRVRELTTCGRRQIVRTKRPMCRRRRALGGHSKRPS